MSRLVLYGEIRNSFKDDWSFDLESVIGFTCVILHPWWIWWRGSCNLFNTSQSFSWLTLTSPCVAPWIKISLFLMVWQYHTNSIFCIHLFKLSIAAVGCINIVKYSSPSLRPHYSIKGTSLCVTFRKPLFCRWPFSELWSAFCWALDCLSRSEQRLNWDMLCAASLTNDLLTAQLGGLGRVWHGGLSPTVLFWTLPSSSISERRAGKRSLLPSHKSQAVSSL